MGVVGVACSGGTTTRASAASVAQPVEQDRRSDAVQKPRVVEVPSGVEQVASDCAPDNDERCNALDEDCDGIIDESCGYRTGAVQITAAWSSEADIDLFVTDPDGEVLSFKEPRSANGGRMDHDARGRCRREQSHRHVENLYWVDMPASGEYHVELRYWSPCGLASTTRTRVSVAVGGELLGTFERVLEPEQRATLVRFELP